MRVLLVVLALLLAAVGVSQQGDPAWGACERVGDHLTRIVPGFQHELVATATPITFEESSGVFGTMLGGIIGVDAVVLGEFVTPEIQDGYGVALAARSGAWVLWASTAAPGESFLVCLFLVSEPPQDLT